MNQEWLVSETAVRSGLPPETVKTVVAAMADLIQDRVVSPDDLVQALLGGAEPLDSHPDDPRDPAAVARLLERAKAHPLGIDYLKKGHLGSVAATFEAHAFTVLSARDLLG